MLADQSHNSMGQAVGAKLRAARIAKKYTQGQLAAPDFSVSYISAIERGQIQPSLRALEILAHRLGLSSTQLFTDTSQNGTEYSIPTSTPGNDENEITLTLIVAHIHILQGQTAQAIAQLHRLTAKDLKLQQQLQQRYLLGWAYLDAAQLQKCEQFLSEAARLAGEQQNSYMSLQALNLLGIVYAAMHNYPQALQSHQHCLELLEHTQPQNPFFTSSVYNQLGLHHMHLENYDAAIEMFQQAIAIAGELANFESLQSIYWHMCQYYARANEYYLATLYARKCLHLYHQQVGPLIREINHHLGRAMLKKDQEEARVYLEKALQQERIVQDQLTSASLTIHLAAWFLDHKELDRAEEYALKARELTLTSGASIIAAEVLLLQGRIKYAQSQYEEGDRSFVAGLEMLERLRNQDELADQWVLYAQLLEKRGKNHEAFSYYRRAFQSGAF